MVSMSARSRRAVGRPWPSWSSFQRGLRANLGSGIPAAAVCNLSASWEARATAGYKPQPEVSSYGVRPKEMWKSVFTVSREQSPPFLTGRVCLTRVWRQPQHLKAAAIAASAAAPEMAAFGVEQATVRASNAPPNFGTNAAKKSGRSSAPVHFATEYNRHRPPCGLGSLFGTDRCAHTGQTPLSLSFPPPSSAVPCPLVGRRTRRRTGILIWAHRGRSTCRQSAGERAA